MLANEPGSGYSFHCPRCKSILKDSQRERDFSILYRCTECNELFLLSPMAEPAVGDP